MRRSQPQETLMGETPSEKEQLELRSWGGKIFGLSEVHVGGNNVVQGHEIRVISLDSILNYSVLQTQAPAESGEQSSMLHFFFFFLD